MMRSAFGMLFGWLLIVSASIAHADDCASTPSNAATKLPTPLDQWGQLLCTPYGHVIAAHQGWIWTEPGAYLPVWIPAQMVKQNPETLGNRSYFTKIDLTKIDSDELQLPYQAFQKVFPADAPPPAAYRLDVTSNSGKTLRVYFLDYEKAPWGIWCTGGQCDSASIFMLLDMTKEPRGRPERSN